MHPTFKAVFSLNAALLLLPLALPAAHRASSEEQAAEELKAVSLEEVVVTAQKREERLQDVPISISLLEGGDLDRSRAQGLTETLNRVPGVAAPITALGAPQVVIRGVTASSLS